MTTETAFFVFATFTNVFASLWILGAMFTPRLQSMPKWHMAGLLIGAVGLMWQAFRNVWFLITGESMADNDWPMWYLKDFCFFMIAAHSVWLVFGNRLDLQSTGKPPAKKPAAKKSKTTTRK